MRNFLLIVLIWIAAPLWADESPGRLTVTGEGRIAAVPDMATIRLGALHEDKTAARALAANSAAVAATIAELTAAGIERRDIQTSGLNLSPRWSRGQDSMGPDRITGFVASNQVTVRVRELDRLGAVLDAVVAAGANTFHGLTFGLQDPAPLMDEARDAAVADARRKAERMAAAADVGLGPLVRMEETGDPAPQPVMMEMARTASADVPVAEGEVEVRARVTMVYAIAAGD